MRPRYAGGARPVLRKDALLRIINALRLRADACLDYPTPEMQEERQATLALLRRMKSLL